MQYRSLLAAGLAVLMLAACGSVSKKKESVYRHEHFAPDSPFELSFDVPPAA